MKIIQSLPAKKSFYLPAFPDSSWTLTGKIATTAQTIELTADLFTPDGTSWNLTISSALSATIPAGSAVLYLVAETSDQETIAWEEPVQVVAIGSISHAQKMVVALETMMEGKSASDYASLSIEDRSITTLTPEELTKWLSFYRRQLADEIRAASGRAGIRSWQVQF